jgi:cysteine synthase B
MIETLTRGRHDLQALIGNTPLVRLRAFEAKASVELYAKLESQNPGGSVKDRAALAMILEGERTGALSRDRILLDATSGNTGIAYAMIAAVRGYRVQLCLPSNVTKERTRLLQAFGAELVLTDPMEGSDGAILEARRIHAADPGRYFYPDQYNNPANWRAHYEHTGPEIAEQTDGRATHFVATVGTSGTFVGTGRRLRQLIPSIRLVSVQPDSPLHGIEGLKHMATALVPGIYDPDLADEQIEVPTEDAYRLTRRLAREEGLFVGPSSGAALAAALRVASSIDRGVIVTVFPDGGDRYLSESFWNAEPATRQRGEPAIVVSQPALQDIRRHAEQVYNDECCGALIGTRTGEVAEAYALSNTTDGERRRRFLVGPREYREAEARATATGRELVGFYHSHPDHPAVPSAFDLEHAWPNLSYLIVSVRNGRAAEARSWRLRADRSGFDEEDLCQ